MDSFNKVLVLAPHPDDGEFGCGGTLKKLSDAGCEIWYAAFSPCNKSLPSGFEPDALFTELEQAASCLGIAEDHLITHRFEVREFLRDRQEILETLIRLRSTIQPELVLLPNSFDIHQDHHTIYQEGLRAFKQTRILGYELPWNNSQCEHNFFVSLNEEHLETKISALKAYESQYKRFYASEELIRSLATVRGVQAGSRFAEGFQALRWFL